MRHQIIHFLKKSIPNRFNRIFLVFQYYVLLWNYKKSFANNGYHKNLFSKRMVSIRKHFLQGLIEKKILSLAWRLCVSPCKKVSPDIPNRNRKGIKWDIFLIFFDIRNPRLLLSHLHENFREKWFLEKKMYRLLQLLLGSDVGGVSALLLTTIGGSGMKTSITFTANHFVGIVFLGQKSQGWFNDTTTKSQHQMKSRFCKK